LLGKFRMLITGCAYGPNAGAQFKVRIGDVSLYAAFQKGTDSPETVRLKFSVPTPCPFIEITVPYPTAPEGDRRAIGIGFVQLRIVRPLSSPTEGKLGDTVASNS